jgi:hypothetical protein
VKKSKWTLSGHWRTNMLIDIWLCGINKGRSRPMEAEDMSCRACSAEGTCL